MTNSSNEEKKSYVCVGREGGGGVGGYGGGVRGDVGVGVACSLRNFYGTRELNFHWFRVGGFKRGIGNFATKQR